MESRIKDNTNIKNRNNLFTFCEISLWFACEITANKEGSQCEYL